MPFAFDVVSLLIGLTLGAAAVWLALRAGAATAAARLEAAEAQAEELRAERAEREGKLLALHSERAELATALDKEREAAAEKLALLTDAQAKLQDVFRSLSADALDRNNRSFLDLARTTLEKFQEGARTDLEQRQKAIADLIRPMHQSLEKMDGQIQEMEKARAGAYEGLKTQVGSLVQTQEQLRSETGNLVRALRSPNVRGRWGEIQLKRVVELAGMLDHCDFTQQVSVVAADDSRLRPDLVVRLPGGKIIVVDAKTPLEAYLDGAGLADDEARRVAMTRHARHVREHMRSLGGKSYWSQFDGLTPEFVVMFLPGENFFSAALESDPALIEAGIDQSVIPATPTTLIALLRAVSYGWRQERLAENARVISQLGRELFERLSTMGDHMASLGSQLGRSVESYNRAVGSLETRVLVTARKLKELDAAPESGAIPELAPLEQAPRSLQAPELRALAEAGGD
ncbi:MAG TPA: DNA recombination protein RmuC [Alphaproteobacteria bacterium]|nr:DNA recombination protein RmuC [Alphaproteobacteria bacterium]